jgi:hypothetical protein
MMCRSQAHSKHKYQAWPGEAYLKKLSAVSVMELHLSKLEFYKEGSNYFNAMRFVLSDGETSPTFSYKGDGSGHQVNSHKNFPKNKPIRKIQGCFNAALGDLKFWDKDDDLIVHIDGNTAGTKEVIELREDERIVGVTIHAGDGYIGEISFTLLDTSRKVNEN